MKQRDILALMDGIAPGIAASFAKAIAPVLARLDAAEKRVAELEKAPADIDLDIIVTAAVERVLAARAPKEVAAIELKIEGEELKKVVAEAVGAVGPMIEKLAADVGEVRDMVMGLPGPDGLVALVDKTVDAKVAAMPVAPTAEAVAALMPKPPTADEVAALVPAATPGKDADPEVIRAMVDEAVAKIPPAAPGKSVTIDEVRPLVDDAVGAAFATLRVPEDGKDADPDQTRALVLAAVEKAVAALPKAPTAEEVAALMPAGKDGRDGVDGKDGRDGIDGKDGVAGADGRTEINLADAYEGVWKEGMHKRGSLVTWGGSLWLAKADTEAKPETDGAWTLVVKRGRDGKDGRDLTPPPPTPVKL